MARTRGAAAMVFRACIALPIVCFAIFAEDISVVSCNVRHFQGYSPSLKPDWSRWADTEWYSDPAKPGFYDFFAGVLGSLNADIIAIQGSSVPEHDQPGTGYGGHGEMAIVPELASRLGMHCYVQERSRFHGFAFLSRFPIVDAADHTHQGSPGTGLVRITVETGDGGMLHVYNTYLHYQDPDVRRRELAFNARVIEEENLTPHVYLGDWRLTDMGHPELEPLREAGYRGRGHDSQGIWVRSNGGAEILGFAPVENEWTSHVLSPTGTVGAPQLPVKAVLRVGGPLPLPEERRAAMLEALNLTEESLRRATTEVTAATRPVHAPDILRQMVVEESRCSRMTLVPVARAEFQLAVRIETKEQPENSWDVAARARTVRPVAAGDAIVASFWARADSGQDAAAPGRMTFRFQETSPPWRGPTVEFRDLGEDWRLHRLVFAATDNYRPGEAEIRFHCGHARQILELGGLQVVNCRDHVPLADLVAMSRYEQYLQDCGSER